MVVVHRDLCKCAFAKCACVEMSIDLLFNTMNVSVEREMIVSDVDAELVETRECSVLDGRGCHGQACSIGDVQDEPADRRDDVADRSLRVVLAKVADDRFAAVHLVADDVLVRRLLAR